MRIYSSHGKLQSKWQGPYHVIDTAPHGAITIQDDDGNAYKVNGQRLKLFLDHNKAHDEEIDVIDLVNPILISKKSHIGQKGRWAHSTSKHMTPPVDPRKLEPTRAQPGSADPLVRPNLGQRQ